MNKPFGTLYWITTGVFAFVVLLNIYTTQYLISVWVLMTFLWMTLSHIYRKLYEELLDVKTHE